MLSAISLPLLLSACANPTDSVETRIIVKLPPAGLVVPCEKPDVIGTWPEVVTKDIPRLKQAVSQCAGQTQDYLNWRAEQEALQPTTTKGQNHE